MNKMSRYGSRISKCRCHNSRNISYFSAGQELVEFKPNSWDHGQHHSTGATSLHTASGATATASCTLQTLLVCYIVTVTV